LVTVSADGLTLTVTPYAGNEVASLIGTFNFVIPAGSVKDLAGNALTTLEATLVVNNVAPVALNDSYTVAEDGVLSVAARGVLTNDTDLDPTILTAGKVSDPVNGTLTLNADGSFTYTPNANFNGTDTFTYKANDGLADSNVATVTITVTAVNDAPVAVNDTYSTSFETTLTVALPGVLDNDTDADGDTLTAALVTGVNNGSLTLNANGSFTYTPNANFNGVDTFTYKANDGTTDSNVATVTITVTAWVNTPPVAVADTYETDQGVELVVATPGVLSNDYDIDDDVLTATLKTNVTKGTLVLLEDGSFSYKPDAGFCGTDSFVYTLVSYPRITDAGWTADATVTITVYCDAIISSEDLDGPFYVGNQQEFHVRLQNPAPGHTYGSLAASVFVDDITTADFTSVELKHPIYGTWVPLTPVVDGDGLRLDVGPIASFPLTSGFDQTLTFRITFNTAGDYPVTGTLYDGVILPAKAIASYSDTMVVAGLEAQDFGYMYTSGVMGVTAGFGNVNFDLSQAASIKVELFSGSAGAYQLMQTNTAIDPDLMAAWTQFSTPFDIFGSFDYAADGYWTNVRETEYGQTAIPTRVLATVTLPGGITLTAENTILTGDRGYIIDTLIEEIVSAPEYDYDPPYIPIGESEFDLSSLTYTGTYTAPQVLAGAPMNDMARLLGALYRQAGSSITSIVYNGTTYTWDTTGTLVGSNWEDASGKTLVSQVTADFQAAVAGGTWDPNAGFVMTVHDDYEHSATVTFKLVILNTLDAEIASAPAYAYTPAYTYVGSYAFVDATNVYTVTYDDTAFAPGAMNDMARYLGALNRQAGATVASISYKGTTYTWYVPAGQTELQGSNWRDASGTTLVRVITAEALAGLIDPAVGITLTLSDVFHTETVIFRFVINDTIAPTIAGMVANGAGTYGDVAAVGTTFTVDQGYTVASITLTMSEPVTVTAGTEVTLAGVPYGLVTVSADGLTLTVTPYAGNEVASLIGTFNFVIPAGSVKDLAGNALTTLEATLVVNNVAPVAVDDAYTVAEDGVLTVEARGVLTNDTDFDPTILTAVKVSDPANGTLTLNADGSFTYTPAANYHGTDTFTYKANDGTLDSKTATVTITVTPVNDAPVAQDQSVTTAEDTAKAITLVATDADGDTLTYAIVAQPAQGSVTLVGNVATYTPAANYNGPDSFTFKANDGTLDSNTATVTITVTPVNDAPVAQDQSVTTAEDTAKAITLV
ncbi:MAG: Ig-like domain-containing protein, partial [Anaerolineaceae bacterium]|nr:Ig-like domain-containing protein [Anaerolineaceae bacterium]